MIGDNKGKMDNCLRYDSTYDLTDVHARLLKILKDIHKFCEEHDISYALCGGSALGAVRHNGFIPWDDDADIMLDRKNYDRFLKEFSVQGYVIEKIMWVYRVRDVSDESDNPMCVDLFVFDNVPEKKLARIFKILNIKLLQGMIKEKVNYKEYPFVYRFPLFATHVFGKLFTKRFKLKRYDKVMQWGNKKKTANKALYNDLFKYLGVCYDADIMTSLQLHTFEDTELYIPTGYDDYLTAAYGDYMTPPPVENRVPEHSMKDKG